MSGPEAAGQPRVPPTARPAPATTPEPAPRPTAGSGSGSVAPLPPVPKVPKQVSPGDVRAAIEKVRSAEFSYEQTSELAASGDIDARAQLDGKRSALSAACDELIAATDKAMTAMVGSTADLGTLQEVRRRLIDQADGTDAKLFVGAAAYAVITTRQGKKVTNPVKVSDQLSGNPAWHQTWGAIERGAQTARDANLARYQARVALAEARRTGVDVPKAKAELAQKLEKAIEARNELSFVILASDFSADATSKHFGGQDIDIQTMVSDALGRDVFGR